MARKIDFDGGLDLLGDADVDGKHSRKKITMDDWQYCASGEEAIQTIRDLTDTCMLAFSMGKDSIGAWLAIKDRFERVEPFFMYLIPDLEFIEEALDYYESKLGSKIHRLPHPSFYRMLNNFAFQPPERCQIIEDAGLPSISYDILSEALMEDLGLNPGHTYTATGVRAADSPMRYMHFKKRGGVSWNRRAFYPVFDWNKERLLTEIKRAGIKLPIEYKWFGRSFDGLDLRFLYQVRKHAPRDYQRILEWFPLADLEIFRYEQRHQL